jgi:putative transposase
MREWWFRRYRIEPTNASFGGMPRYRRYFSDGQTVFLTLTTAERRPWLSHEGVKERLLDALRATRRLYPFKHHGHVLLHDHLHLLLSPHDGVEVPKIVGSFKRAANARLGNSSTAPAGHAWQRRYYDHLIRDEQDFSRHLDYLHYNPVKHGLVTRAADWSWSSYPAWQARGIYPQDWGNREPENIRDMSE